MSITMNRYSRFNDHPKVGELITGLPSSNPEPFYLPPPPLVQSETTALKIGELITGLPSSNPEPFYLPPPPLVDSEIISASPLAGRSEQEMSSSSITDASSSISAEPQLDPESRLRRLPTLLEGTLDRFNEAYDIGNLEDARSVLKNVNFPYADVEVCTQLKVKYRSLLKEIVSYPSSGDLDVKIKFLAVFFLSQIPIMMRKSFEAELELSVREINKRINEIKTPLPGETYITKKLTTYYSSDYLPNEPLNSDNYQIFADARRNPTFEYEENETHIDKGIRKERLSSDPEFSNRKNLRDRLSAVLKQAFPHRIISSDFDAPSDVLAVLDKEKEFVHILELNGNGLDERILIEIINLIDQTSLRTLNLFGIAWTCGIANCLADKLRIGAKMTKLTIGEPTEKIASEISDLLLPALVENDSICGLSTPDSSFSDPSQRNILSQVQARNGALADVREYRRNPGPEMFFEWGNWFRTGSHQYVQQNGTQALKWHVEAAKLRHVESIRNVTIHLAGDVFNLEEIRERLRPLSLTLQQLQQWIEELIKMNSLPLKERQRLTYNLGQLYENRMIGLPSDRDKMAVKHYSDAATSRDGHPGLEEARTALVRMSERGRGVEGLLLTIERNSLPLELRQVLAYNLGQLYENGAIGLPNDRDKMAVKLYRKAAGLGGGQPGLVRAQMALARMSEHYRGIGEKTDGIWQARFWYNEAALQGDRQAATEKQRLDEQFGWR